MLAWLGGPYQEGKPYAHKVTERRLRLFAVACCRRVWSLLAYQSRKAVRMAERQADNHTIRLEVPWLDWRDGTANSEPWLRDWSPCASNAHEAADRCTWNPTRPEHAANILRSTFGNPWHPVTLQATCPRCKGEGEITTSHRADCHPCNGTGKVGQFDPAWITPQVATLAESAYRDRLPDGALDPVTLAALADALIEAGCPEAVGCPNHPPENLWHKDICQGCHGTLVVAHPVLAQLRGPGPLYRGAWSVDLLTGRS